MIVLMIYLKIISAMASLHFPVLVSPFRSLANRSIGTNSSEISIKMNSVLRRRIPWGSQAAASEEIPLIEAGSSSILEGAAAEETAFGVFAGIEEAGAALDSSGIGAPLGIAVGILGAIGFGAYEIYEHLASKGQNVDRRGKVQGYEKIKKMYENAKQNPDKHIQRAKDLAQQHSDNQPTIEPLEHQHPDFDFESLEDQKPVNTYYQTLPGSKYIGPGNPVDNGTPTNKVDFAAKQHDIAYGQARNDADVREADEKFKTSAQNSVAEALSFGGNPIEGIHGAVGYLGIQAKNIYEDTFNSGKSAYPTFAGKTWHLLNLYRRVFTTEIVPQIQTTLDRVQLNNNRVIIIGRPTRQVVLVNSQYKENVDTNNLTLYRLVRVQNQQILR